MRFQVPQFIEIESKIFGPLTFKQFIYLAGGAGIIFLIYITLPFFIAVMLIVPVGAFAIALSFYKVNNRPFIKSHRKRLPIFHGAKNLCLEKRENPTADDH